MIKFTSVSLGCCLTWNINTCCIMQCGNASLCDDAVTSCWPSRYKLLASIMNVNQCLSRGEKNGNRLWGTGASYRRLFLDCIWKVEYFNLLVLVCMNRVAAGLLSTVLLQGDRWTDSKSNIWPSYSQMNQALQEVWVENSHAHFLNSVIPGSPNTVRKLL